MSLLIGAANSRFRSARADLDLSTTSASIAGQQATTVDFQVVLERSGVSGEPTLSVTGLPANVTASFPEGDTFPVGVQYRTVRITIGAGATVASDQPFTVSVTGATRILSMFLTVTAAPAIVLTAASGTALTVAQGSTVDLSMTLTRATFTDTVTLAVTGLPADVTASYPDGQTYTGSTTTRRVRVSADAGASLISNDAFTITASGTGVSDSAVAATVSVVASAPASAFTPNIPSGLTQIGDTVWPTSLYTSEPTNYPSGWSVSPSTSFPLRPRAVVAESGPDSSNSLRHMVQAGEDNGGMGQVWTVNNPALTDEVYVSFSFKVSSNWQHHGSETTKVFYPLRRSAAGGNENCFHWGLYPHPRRTPTSTSSQIYLESQAGVGNNNAARLNNANGYTGTAPFEIPHDTWCRAEAYFKYNTPGAFDGLYKCWLSLWNGSAWASPVLVSDYSTVKYSPDSLTTVGWTRPRWDLYFGGNSTTTIPADQYLYFNRNHVSVKV